MKSIYPNAYGSLYPNVYAIVTDQGSFILSAHAEKIVDHIVLLHNNSLKEKVTLNRYNCSLIPTIRKWWFFESRFQLEGIPALNGGIDFYRIIDEETGEIVKDNLPGQQALNIARKL